MYACVNQEGTIVVVCSNEVSAATRAVEGSIVVRIPEELDPTKVKYDRVNETWVEQQQLTARERRKLGRDWKERRSIDINHEIELSTQLAAITDVLFAILDIPDIADRIPNAAKAGMVELRAQLAEIKKANPKL